MKRKLAMLMMAGALTVTGFGGVTAHAADQETEVTYYAGGSAVGANAFVKVPTSLDFTDTQKTLNANVQLITVVENESGGTEEKTDGTGLADNFKADVTVDSSTGFTLENSGYTAAGQEGQYELKYGSNTGSTEQPNTLTVGTLSKENLSIAGTATLTKAPTVAGSTGIEKFSDVLTEKTLNANVQLITVVENESGAPEEKEDGTGLASDFKADVTVDSSTGFTLENSGYTAAGQEGQYTLTYGSNTGSTSNTGQLTVGTLNKDNLSIAGTATLTKAPTVAGNTGIEKFSDVLTYTITVGTTEEAGGEAGA